MSTGKVWFSGTNPDFVLGTVLEGQFRPVLKAERNVHATGWVVSVMVSDEDFLSPLGLRELTGRVLEGFPDDVLVAVQEKARHLAEGNGVAA